MNELGGVRWQMWAAGFAFVATAVGGFVGCDDDETTGSTTSATGTGTGTATTSTGTGTGTASNTTTSTTSAGCGGAAACEQLCEDAQAKYAACFVQGSGGGDAGGAGGAGGSSSGSGGGETWTYDCDEQGQCYSRCIMDATCEDIRVHDDSYDSCVGCCNDPYLC